MRTALVAGASGLVGGHCVASLLASPEYERVRVLVRKPLSLRHPKLDQVVIDFEHLSSHRSSLAAADVYCALGTTIKKAGTREAFRRVDLEYPRRLAETAAKEGAAQFLLVSSMGANAGSRFFYNRVKGEVEEALRDLPYRGVYVFRPSLLLGQRDERRSGEEWAERVSGAFTFLFKGPLKKYAPVEAASVARAMVRIALEAPGGYRVYESDTIHHLGDR